MPNLDALRDPLHPFTPYPQANYIILARNKVTVVVGSHDQWLPQCLCRSFIFQWRCDLPGMTQNEFVLLELPRLAHALNTDGDTSQTPHTLD